MSEQSEPPMKIRIATLALLAFLFPSPFSGTLGQASTASSPSKYDFGTHEIGTTSAPIAVPVANPGATAVKFKVQLDASDYAIEKDECTDDVAPKATCVVYVTFSPMAEGSRPGQLSITYPSGTGSATSSLAPISITGMGKLADLGISSTRVCFPPQQTGKVSAPQTITLRNNSTSDLV